LFINLVLDETLINTLAYYRTIYVYFGCTRGKKFNYVNVYISVCFAKVSNTIDTVIPKPI